MSLPGPIASNPKAITPQNVITPKHVRKWFSDTMVSHSKLEGLKLDAAEFQFVAIAGLVNWIRIQGNDPVEQWHQAIHDVQKAVEVLITTLPYVWPTTEFSDSDPRDLYSLYKAAQRVRPGIGKPRSRGQNAPHPWQAWAKALAPCIYEALVAAGHKRVSLTWEHGPFVAIMYQAIFTIGGDSVEIGHSAIAEFFKKNRKAVQTK